MKVKGIPFSEVKAQALSSPKAQAAYEVAKQEEEFYKLIQNMKQKAGIATLERYATACGVNLKITIA
ncbi:transcriptional regulator [Photorhabdus bodei]|uniref:Transcriptional regulator n=1 Tax=Photorhabdus bodei TaxID=2029681 RepID=A0ABX0AFU4_9GAMM|nr:transcriptional regulator [Photorhabdus bodei]NDK97607.1 transcriptional regulator [Photorhabdus bodei]NDL01856.1 transcriptional regulator [Photorhabdus bodei]NDL08667.1 transcriptional regulator [Photorhabdus bodei]